VPRIREEIAIDAPPAHVFEACSNPEVLPLCQPGVTSVTQDGLTDDRIGDSFLARYAVMGGRYEQRFTYVEYANPSRIVWQFEGLTVGTMDFTLAPTEIGTHVQLSIDYEAPGGLFTRVLAAGLFAHRPAGLAEHPLAGFGEDTRSEGEDESVLPPPGTR